MNWPRHWPSRSIGALFLLAMILIVVPGEPASRTIDTKKPAPLIQANPLPMGLSAGSSSFVPSRVKGPHVVEEYSHGWPLQYLRRANGYGGPGWRPVKKFNFGASQWIDTIYLPIWWTEADAWPFRSDRSEWRAGALVIDLLVAALIVVLATLAAEHWIVRRKSLFRLRLVDMLAVTTVAAICLGWWQWHARLQQFEEKWVRAIPALRFDGTQFVADCAGSSSINFTPVWLRRLLGSTWLTPWCSHYTHLKLPWNVSEDEINAVGRFPYLQRVYIQGHPSKSALQHWARLSVPKSVVISATTKMHEDPAIDFTELAKLPGLDELDVSCQNLLVEDLTPLVVSTSLRTVQLSYASVPALEAKRFLAQHVPGFELIVKQSPRRMFGPPEGATLADAARRRLARWGSGQTRNPLRISGDGWIDLELSGIKLTRGRLERLRPICANVDDLWLAEESNVDGMLEFIKACEYLKSLGMGDYQMTNAHLRSLAELKGLRELSFRQGQTTPEGLVSLVESLSLENLEINASTLTRDELAAIEDAASEHAMIHAYRDLDQEQEIYSANWYSPEDAERDKLHGVDNPFGF